MFEMIRRWLGIGSPRSPEPKDAVQGIDTVAPLISAPGGIAQAGEGETHSFVCHEAVLNRNERIDGYEFALRRKLQSRMLKKSALVRRVHDDAMLRNLALFNMSSLLGHRFALIHLSPASLNNPLLESFSNLNVVIMFIAGAAATTDPAAVRANLQRLRQSGVRYGWTLSQPWPEVAEFLPEADFIEVESTAFDGVQLKAMCRNFRAISGSPKLIASELQASDDFSLCYHCGFDYFMGPFVSSRDNWHPVKSEINHLRVIEVLNLIRAGAEFNTIADCLRTEPVMTFKLLRYVNSPGVGLLQQVDDIPQALLTLGSDRLYRWLSLLLFDFKRTGYRESVLYEQVLARARFLEMLAGQGRVPAAADQLFMTGLFSLLDVMMGQSLSDILKQVSLPEPVAAALKGEPGPIRDALFLAIAVESGTPDEMAAAAAGCDLDATAVIGTMIEALAWSEQLSAVSE